MGNLSVSIIVPNYNGEKLILQTLPFIVGVSDTYAGASEIIIVDHASTDNSVDIIQEKFPEIEVITHDWNKRFSDSIEPANGGKRLKNLYASGGSINTLSAYF